MLSESSITQEQAFNCVGEGWHSLIEDLYSYITNMKSTVAVSTIKEKYGILRFYADIQTIHVGKIEEEDRDIPYFDEEIGLFNKFVQNKESESGRLCEACGQAGTLVCEKGWWKTLCITCRNEGS